MTRGNQREQDRQKAQKKVGNRKTKESGSSLAKRREEHTKNLQEKQNLKQREQQGESSSASGKANGTGKT